MEIQVLAGSNWLMGSQLSPIDILISNVNTYINKRYKQHRNYGNNLNMI